ncbi:MAG: pilus assembly protein TadG-related protein [Desulfuromonadaceae bacterium]|nr:pilus assembly protein TadG-related protein [Desulfuromonas sp.]MDY0184399.1 pilus assembly protein TadG-related protein [Desulfuromonadaceae bacterium]
MFEHCRQAVRSNQKGQAAVFVLALLGVVLLCTVFLYKSGRITSEKMQLQNAADAAAYSAIVLEARSLNFAAYTNRAMVGNEVGVGQMVGLLSWADQLSQAQEYANIYVPVIESIGAALAIALIPTIGGPLIVEAATSVIVATLETIAGVLTTVGEAMGAFLGKVTGPVITGLSLVNKVYSTSQVVYHGATYGAVVKSLYQNLEDNTEGTQFNRNDILGGNLGGARPSDLGIIALVGHVPSFWKGYTQTYSSPTSAAKNKKQKEKDQVQKDGMGRFAATVRDARDPFSSGDRDKSTNRNWNLGLGLELSVTVPIINVEIGGEYFLGGESYGASELRETDGYVWSAIDTTVLGSKLKIFGKWFPFPAVFPFGSGAYQAPPSGKSALSSGDVLPSVPEKLTYGHRSQEAYGGAGDSSHLVAWPKAITQMKKNVVSGNPYSGLKPYRDMASMELPKPGGGLIPFEAPFFMVGVTRTFKDIDSKGPQFAAGLDLTQYPGDTKVDCIAAIARAELYFMRPEHPGYFARKDGRRENPNVFSPFWQARLVDSSDRQRFMALALQQNVLWLAEDEKKLIGGGVLDDVLKLMNQVLEGLADVVDRVLRMFL